MNSKTCFIDIVNKFIYGGVYEPPKDINWFEIKHIAEIHGMGGIVGVVINRSHIEMPLECYEYFDYMVFECARNGILWEMRYKETTSALSKANVEHIIVKGYILRNLYTEKDMRTMGDLDFVVRKEDMEKAKEAMINAGYKFNENYRGDWKYEKDGMHIELHEGLMDADVGLIDYEKYMSNIFENIKSAEGFSYELTDEFHFIYQMMHIMKHFYGEGAGIRMILDMALFIKEYNDSLNWNYINNELKKLKIELFAQNILALCYRLFKCGKEILIDEELYNEMFDYIMAGGVFGFARANYELSLGRDRIAKKESIVKVFFKRAFPSDETMRGLFSWYRNKPIALLPVAWIYRWVHSVVIKRGRLVKSLVSTAGNEESKKQLELLKKIGLYRR